MNLWTEDEEWRIGITRNCTSNLAVTKKEQFKSKDLNFDKKKGSG